MKDKFYSIAGTILDRRIKASNYREEIKAMYNEGFWTQKEIANIFGVKPLQIWRYLHYDYYKDRAKQDSRKYYEKHKNTNKFKKAQIKSKLLGDVYKDMLVMTKHAFEEEKENIFESIKNDFDTEVFRQGLVSDE